MKTVKLLELVVISSVLILSSKLIDCQDIIFPGDDEAYTHVSGSAPASIYTQRANHYTHIKTKQLNDQLIKQVTERKPLKVDNDRCPENMLLYPDDGPKSAWVCDCKPRFVYFPVNQTCHEVFQRGPCPSGHYVFLALNETQPKCVKNPCTQEGYVGYRGVCHPLRAKGGPCAEDAVLNVNETTFQLECLQADLVPFVIIEAPKRSCPKGSRRSSLGICKLVL